MSLKCKIGVHEWDGCKCAACGKTRDEHHDLSLDCEKCAKCGKIILRNHDWSKDCEQCSKCGKTRENNHVWDKDCEKCSKCGQTRTNKHEMVAGLCVVCGHGDYTDPSDGKVYKVVKIGGQIVMAENYAKKPDTGNFWAYENHNENKSTFGYLYDWETAKTIVPRGWHLPTKSEWESLYQFLGGNTRTVYDQLKSGGQAGFEGLMGGWRSARGTFNGLNASAHFWCDTSEDNEHAWQLKLNAYGHHAEFEKAEKVMALSVRLFRDK